MPFIFVISIVTTTLRI